MTNPARVAVWVQQAGAISSASASGAAGQSPRYSGTVAEGSGAMLSFQVGGTIMPLPIEEGQRVRKGRLIATVDITIYWRAVRCSIGQA